MFNTIKDVALFPIRQVQYHLLNSRWREETEFWQNNFLEQIQKHPPPWEILPESRFVIVAKDGFQVFFTFSADRAKFIVGIANRFFGNNPE